MTAPLDRQHDVLRLQVTVHDLLFVQVLQGEDRLRRIEVSVTLHGLILIDNIREKITALDELYFHIEVSVVLERRIKFHDEGTVAVVAERVSLLHLECAEVAEHLALVDDMV